ncbi:MULTISPECIES: glutathione-regulated potassium-efflux system oxidoreductase KefF [Polaromonas]|uniref:NAD(P)H-dependent oxidoreductase n=1 Tax=Polaromonas aquatica TaxID=332657 RepID=A0ABW1U016_9BURK
MASFPTNDTTAPGLPAETDIYVIAAHPAWRESRVNRPLMAAAQALPRVQVQDLYSSYPDYAIDVAKEQAALARASLVVLLHPIQWYSMPALQKLWLDDVLTYGWAYGKGGDMLQGKDLWLVATTGGPEASYHPQGYNHYFFDAFLPPYEQTAALCGMRFLPPLILHGAHSVGPDVIARHLETFRQRLQSYPDWPEMDEIEQCTACVVPINDRPVENDKTNTGTAVRSDGPPQASTAPSGGSALHEVKSVGAI